MYMSIDHILLDIQEDMINTHLCMKYEVLINVFNGNIIKISFDHCFAVN